MIERLSKKTLNHRYRYRRITLTASIPIISFRKVCEGRYLSPQVHPVQRPLVSKSTPFCVAISKEITPY